MSLAARLAMLAQDHRTETSPPRGYHQVDGVIGPLQEGRPHVRRASESQAEINAKGARLKAGEMYVQCAFGYGGRGLPPGAAGVLFCGLNGAQTWRLVDGAGHSRIPRAKGTMTALSDFPDAPVWENNPDVTTKQVD